MELIIWEVELRQKLASKEPEPGLNIFNLLTKKYIE